MSLQFYKINRDFCFRLMNIDKYIKWFRLKTFLFEWGHAKVKNEVDRIGWGRGYPLLPLSHNSMTIAFNFRIFTYLKYQYELWEMCLTMYLYQVTVLIYIYSKNKNIFVICLISKGFPGVSLWAELWSESKDSFNVIGECYHLLNR